MPMTIFTNDAKTNMGMKKNVHVKVKRRKIREYLAMNLDYTVPSKVIVDMRNYVKEIVELYPFNHNSNVICPWNGMLFESNMNKKKLTQRNAETFHTFVMKCIFLAKQDRPNVLTGISYLATKVLEAYDEDLKKLLRIISYLRNTINIRLTLEAYDSQTISWYVDSSFGVHKDLKSHTAVSLPQLPCPTNRNQDK